MQRFDVERCDRIKRWHHGKRRRIRRAAVDIKVLHITTIRAALAAADTMETTRKCYSVRIYLEYIFLENIYNKKIPHSVELTRRTYL